MLILGIDTSCDDTGVGVVEDGVKILSNVIASQHASHERFGGIVPALAARQHVKSINPILEAAMGEAGATYDDLDAVAIANDQGLLLSLVVGTSAAKSIALAKNIPLIGIHHLEGHIYSVLMDHPDELRMPFLCLTVAGGHTLLLEVEDHGRYSLRGHTRDDAAGEAYDKVARRLGLGYPGGPPIDRLAAEGDPEAFRFPRPMIDKPHGEFSFSGLKSAVIRTLDHIEADGEEIPVADVCASFQQAVVDVLVKKTLRQAEVTGHSDIALAGGVAMNRQLRETLAEEAEKRDLRTFLPRPLLCIDNGAMVAGAAYFLWRLRGESPLDLDARANAALGQLELRYKQDTKYRPWSP
ncbi:MAG: tRNA (adenosine(37)-N6)-threonylcarbamoyltransferase complex transferase subunit TsaD [Holophagales bacterium]|nr:tRNA (adenosine(37)-N6)-threonylcarbamoyltransferase complex transferase subunit TsaD [Holophagales bacterium]